METSPASCSFLHKVQIFFNSLFSDFLQRFTINVLYQVLHKSQISILIIFALLHIITLRLLLLLLLLCYYHYYKTSSRDFTLPPKTIPHT
jgi:hypothetical protein